jgi:hypothetical protein
MIDTHLLGLEMEGYRPHVAKHLCTQVAVISVKLQRVCKLRDCKFILYHCVDGPV